MTQAAPLTLLSPTAMECPFPTYDAMREESPIYRDAGTGFLVVTRYEDIKAIAADPATFSNKTGLLGQRTSAAQKQVAELYATEGFAPIDTLVTNDPPSHKRYRSLVDKVFSPVRIKEAEAAIVELINELIAAFPQEPFDFVPAFSIPLPVRIIARQLGVPQDREADFKRWSDALIGSANQGLTSEQELENARTIVEMQQFFRDMVRRTREAPDGTLLSALANTEGDEGLMSEAEVVSLLMQILVAGNETTTNATAAAVLRLAQNAELQARLRAEPSLVPVFVEEVLRLDAPLQGLFRRATCAAEVGGVPVPEGSILDIRWGAGNRDERRYACPDAVDLDRKNPSQHLAFGFGIHFCIGNQLARAELRNGITGLLERSATIRLADVAEPVVRTPHFFAHGLRSLMIDFHRR